MEDFLFTETAISSVAGKSEKYKMLNQALFFLNVCLPFPQYIAILLTTQKSVNPQNDFMLLISINTDNAGKVEIFFSLLVRLLSKMHFMSIY